MSDEATEKRVYVGGLSHAVTETDVSGRFKPFGKLIKVELAKTEDGASCRGFGYVNIEITPAQWRRCMSVYTGAKWKGGILRIGEAKEDYMAKLKREWKEATTPTVPAEEKSKQKQKRRKITYAEDMSIVKKHDRPGWKKGRYNRPVLPVKVRKLDGSIVSWDPVKNKNNFEKLFGSVRPKPWDMLCWEYDPDQLASDFEQARKIPASVTDLIQKMETQRNQAPQKSVPEKSPEPAMHSEALQTTDLLDEKDVSLSLDDANLDANGSVSAPANQFEGSSLSAPDPNALAKLASGTFDSDSEDDSETTQDSTAPVNNQSTLDTADPKEDELLEKERERTADILGQVLGIQTPLRSNKNALSKKTLNSTDNNSDSNIPHDDIDSDSKDENSSSDSNSSSSLSDSSESSSSDGSSDDSNDNSSSDDSSSGPSDGNGSDDNDDNDNGDDKDKDESSSDDSDSDDSDSDDSNETKTNEIDTMMEVDENTQNNNSNATTVTKSMSSLFSGTANEETSSSGGGLFGNTVGPSEPKPSSSSSGGFKFSQLLGLEEDAPSAIVKKIEDQAPITGGSTLHGPSIRNLNANRLPMFFADTDSPTFRKPEPIFQREKNEEELERELTEKRADLTREFKAQHRSAMKKTQRMRQRK